jgi:hypothetical protein
MNAGTVAQNLEVAALIWSCTEKARKPDERSGDPAPIGENDDEFVLGDGHLLRPRICARQRRTHAKPPRIAVGFPRRAVEVDSARGRKPD